MSVLCLLFQSGGQRWTATGSGSWLGVGRPSSPQRPRTILRACLCRACL